MDHHPFQGHQVIHPFDAVKMISPLLFAFVAQVDVQALVVLAGSVIAGALTLRSIALKLANEDRSELRRKNEQLLEENAELKARPDIEHVHSVQLRTVEILERMERKLEQVAVATVPPS